MKKKAPKVVLLIFAAVSLLPVPVSAQDAETAAAPIDPVAAELTLNAARFLVEQPRFSFSWFLSNDVVVEGREKITYVSSGITQMDREIGFFAETEQVNTYRDYYYDGNNFTVSSPDKNFYASVPFDGTFEELVQKVRDNTGSVLPLWTLMSSNLPERLIADVDRAAYLGTTLIAGQVAHHIAFTGLEEDWQIWISADEESPLPLMIIGTNTYEQGWPQFRANLMDWNLDPDRDPEQYSFHPDEDDSPITMPWMAAAREEGPAGQEPANTADLAE